MLRRSGQVPSGGYGAALPGQPTQEGEIPMHIPQTRPPQLQRVHRRALLKAGLAAGVTLSTWPLHHPSRLWGAEVGPPKRGGILRVRGYDPPHFDPHQTINFKTNTTLSFVYSTLVRYKVGPEVPPG